ncbi:hypothetical protein VTN77DRAFT_4742 [Rasamsonia byssochlamydoides]|uniref:uncharacterized protein n=1 Tax=Rasamsonia byssochlamydoides TaxID=89139 RepID=UPI003743464F
MSRELRLCPGSCALRLSDIEQLPSDQRTELIQSVANDITAVFIYIARQAEAGNLTTANTAPINDVIGVIRGTEVKHRQKLEEKLGRLQRDAQRCKRERRWLQSELGQIVGRAQVAVRSWKARVDDLTAQLAEAQRRLAFLQEKYELLLSSSGQDRQRGQQGQQQQRQDSQHGQQAERGENENDSASDNSTARSEREMEMATETEKKKKEDDVTVEAQ